VEGGGQRLAARLRQCAQPGWRMVRRLARRAGRNLT
jgi:hypothetical protein